jgi:EAL domain-containing protein (putative c-di-GMP-specific phosphodiesterase class I)
VNVSGVQLRGGELAKTVVDAIEESQVDPASVELEVTEGAMLLDEEDASRCLESLKALGVRVALDDFGTGYSSLSHVKRFPVDSLKIDRSFVRDVATDPEAQAITTAIIAMAHRLGLKVVGEGVETELQDRFLREHGCDELQGYRYGRPMTAGDMALRLGRQVR